MRRMLTVGMLIGGVVLMVIGYLSSAPWGAGSIANSDPRFDFAPTLFVLGVITALASALAYELLPERRKD
jgi:hypothetical protein